MRSRMTLSAVALLLAVATPAFAQRAKGFGGVNPAAIVNQPIAVNGTTSSIATIPLFDHSIHLKDFIPHLGQFSNTPRIGQSAYPGPDDMPGLNYLKAFGFYKPQPVQ